MSTSAKNIRFCYRYQDAANYKLFEDRIFPNKNGVEDLDTLEEQMRSYLFDQEFFYPHELDIPQLSFERYDAELDHDWYFFEGLEWTEEEPDDERDILEFEKLLAENARKAPI